MRLSFVFALALLATQAATGAASAFEATGNAVADGFLRIMESGGFTDVTIDAAATDDITTTLTGLSARSVAYGDRLTITQIAIEDGLIDARNALRAEAILYSGIAMEGDGGARSSAAAITVTAPRLALREGSGSWLGTVLGTFGTMTLTNLEARPADGPGISVANVVVERAADANPAAGRVAFEGAELGAAFFRGPAADVLIDLGYESLNVSGVLAGRWDGDTGDLSLTEVSLAADDLGALALAAEASGLTQERFAELGAGLGSVQTMLPLLQSVKVGALTVAFRDGGLTERIVGRTAALSGSTPDAVRARAVAGLARGLSMVRSPALTTSATEALKSFLAAPGTLSVAMAPPAALSVSQLIGGALMTPDKLPQLLNLSIAALP